MNPPPPPDPAPSPPPPRTAPELTRLKGSRKLALVTAYDATMARLIERAGVDAILVGDSLGMVVQGHSSTLPVTLDQVVYHTTMVVRGAPQTLVIADLPFLTVQAGVDRAVLNAGRLLQEGGCHAVKVEGGIRCRRAIRAMVRADVPVMGHIGLTPQSVLRLGGYRVQRERDALIADARAVVEAGGFSLVLECIPADLAAEITRTVPIPTIGIGAGPACDGQILVAHDLLGLFEDVRPRFVKRYAELGTAITAAVRQYCTEVRGGQYPDLEHSFQ